MHRLFLQMMAAKAIVPKLLKLILHCLRILEEKKMLPLRRNLKEMLYKYLLFFGTNYDRIVNIYKDQYLDVMEDILLFYCDVIKEFLRGRRGKKTKIIQEARRMKILLRNCLLKKMDRILHVLLKVRLAPEIEEHKLLWGDVYMYFLTKVPYKHTDDDVLRVFIAFQKFKTIRTKFEVPMIDKLMLRVCKKTMNELRWVPCLGDIMDKMKRDRFFTVKDMVARYMEYYREKKSRAECFRIEDVYENTEVVSINQMRRLDLCSSFSMVPSASTSSDPSVAQIFADRRNGIRKTVLDLAAQPNTQMDQLSSEFTLFGDDVDKSESPEDPIVVLDDDVIVVFDNLKTVIVIDDDEDSDDPVPIQPTKSPPSRDALSPNKMFLPPEPPVECQPSNQLKQSSTSLAQSVATSGASSSIALMYADSQLLSSSSTIVATQISSIEPFEGEDHSLGQEEKTDSSTHSILPVNNLLSNIIEVDNPLPPANSTNVEHPEYEMILRSQNLSLGENHSFTHKEKTNTSPIQRRSPFPSGLMEVDNSVAPNSFTTEENSVPEPKSTPKEVLPVTLNILPTEKLVPKKVQTTDAQISKRQVKKVDNSLIITINSFSSKVPTSNIQGLGEQQSKPLVLEKSSEVPRQSMETMLSVNKEKTYPPNDQAKLDSNPTRLEEKIEESVKHIQNIVLDLVEKILPPNKLLESQIISPKTIAVAFSADKLAPKNLDTDSQKKPQLVQPVEMRGEFTKQSKVTEMLMLEEVSEKTFEYDSLNQTGKNDSVMEIDTASNNSVKLGSNINSQMDKEIVPLANTISVPPLINQHDNVVEARVSFTMKLPEANRIGVLSIKIPTDLDDSPDSSPEKNPEKSELRHKESETTYISSPSFESIDKTQAKKHFESWKYSERISSSNEMDISVTSNEISTSSNETSEQVIAESSVNTSREVCDESESTSSLELSESSTSSLNESWEIQVEESTRSDDLKNVMELSEPDENMTLEIPSDNLTPETNQTVASGPEPCAQAREVSGQPNQTINYSNITECFTKFVEELSIEDIGTSQSKDLTSPVEDLRLSTIDLAPDIGNANDVIVVKCLMESLKDEENTASGTETVVFSPDEVLTSSDEAVALLVTYSPSSQEESQHFFMCDANLTLSSDPHAFIINEMPPKGDDGASSAGEHSDQTSVDNRTVLHPRSRTLEGHLPLSDSQSYSSQSSPSTLIDTVKNDLNRFDEVSNALESCLTYSGSLSYEAPSLPQDLSMTKVNRLSESESLSSAKHLALSKIANKVSRKSETLRSFKPRRNSFDLTNGGISGLVGMSDTKVCDKTFYNAVEDFRKNVSQSVTSATRVTPQEVDRITSLPFKYSQESWGGLPQQIPQQIPDMSQNILSSNASAKLLQPLKTRVQLEDSLLSPKVSHLEVILPQRTLQVSKPDMSIVKPSDKQLNSLMYSERFSENKLDELYLKEYGNTDSQQNSGLSPQKVHSKRRYSEEALSPDRSLKIYAKYKSVKDLSQSKDRDASLKSYKALIKGVSKSRSSVFRDLENPSRKEEEFVSPSTNLEDTSQKKGPNDHAKQISLNENVFDYNDLFNNGLEGPIGKPMVGKEVEDNWEIGNDAIDKPVEATFSETISGKPDSQLYKATKGTVSPLKSSVSILKKSTKSKGTDSLPEKKSPEKNENSLSTAESGLYVENKANFVQDKQLKIETSSNVSQETTTVPLPQDQEKLQTPKVKESNSTGTLQESLRKTQLPLKKRKLTEDEELVIYIQKFQEEKECKKKLWENISYPAHRQISIADLQLDFPKVKTLAARKLYPEVTAYPDQNYYEYPQGYDQYNDFNDYGNKRSIMNANYPLCVMVGPIHTCVNNQSKSENGAQTRPPPPEIPQYAELTRPSQYLLNMQKTLIPDVAPRQVAEPPQARPKRSRKTGTCSGEAPPAKRGRGRPRKNVN